MTNKQEPESNDHNFISSIISTYTHVSIYVVIISIILAIPLLYLMNMILADFTGNISINYATSLSILLIYGIFKLFNTILFNDASIISFNINQLKWLVFDIKNAILHDRYVKMSQKLLENQELTDTNENSEEIDK